METSTGEIFLDKKIIWMQTAKSWVFYAENSPIL
jgi:hypothetical protein